MKNPLPTYNDRASSASGQAPNRTAGEGESASWLTGLFGEDFRRRYGPWAVIAGGSEGTGASFAWQLAERGVNLALLARRDAPLDALAARIRESCGVEVRTAAVDLTSPTLLEDIEPLVDGIEVGLVVYNAGTGRGGGFLVDQSVDDSLAMVYLNCRGPLIFAHRFAGAMVARGHGGFIFMTSLLAAAGSAYTAAYSATKAFDHILAESLWMELGQLGVDVVAVAAGLIDTPAMRKSGIVKDETARFALDADEVVVDALAALGNGCPITVAGEKNRQVAEIFWPVARVDLIATLTVAASRLWDMPNPVAPEGYRHAG